MGVSLLFVFTFSGKTSQVEPSHGWVKPIMMMMMMMTPMHHHYLFFPAKLWLGSTWDVLP